MDLGPTVEQEPATEYLLESLIPRNEQQHLLTRLPAGTVIHRFGSTSRGIVFVKEGTIEISLPRGDGMAKTIFHIGPGGAVGLTAALSRKVNEFDAVVVEPVVGYFVPVETLREWLASDRSHYVPIARLLSEWNEKAMIILRIGRTRPQRNSLKFQPELLS